MTHRTLSRWSTLKLSFDVLITECKFTVNEATKLINVAIIKTNVHNKILPTLAQVPGCCYSNCELPERKREIIFSFNFKCDIKVFLLLMNCLLLCVLLSWVIINFFFFFFGGGGGVEVVVVVVWVWVFHAVFVCFVMSFQGIVSVICFVFFF